MVSLRVFQRKLPLNDNDSTPEDVVFASEILQSSFFLRSYVTHFFHLSTCLRQCLRACHSFFNGSPVLFLWEK